MTSTYENLREFVFTLPIVDTHEHLPAREELRDANLDVLAEYLGHYFSCDLVSAGAPPEAMRAAYDTNRPLQERWKLLEPYWEAARNTGYGRSLDIAARGIYGIERISGDTISELNDAFCAARKKGGHYQRVLKDLSNIRVSLVDSNLDCDRKFFRSVIRLDDFVIPQTRGSITQLEKMSGRSIHNLRNLEDACEAFLEYALKKGAVSLKCGLAYLRPLKFEKRTASDAERELNLLFANVDPDKHWLPDRNVHPNVALQDYMMHHVLRLADARRLPFEIHTGLQEGNGNFIANSNPELMSGIFHEYRNVRFDIFHISYPYYHTLSALAKNFQNVFIDFAWAHIISPTASVNALVEYLDAVPANKISGFGGDYCFVDGVYGHQVLARENIARALAVKVEEGSFGIEDAKRIAKMILHDNPIAIFGLKLE